MISSTDVAGYKSSWKIDKILALDFNKLSSLWRIQSAKLVGHSASLAVVGTLLNIVSYNWSIKAKYKMTNLYVAYGLTFLSAND